MFVAWSNNSARGVHDVAGSSKKDACARPLQHLAYVKPCGRKAALLGSVAACFLASGAIGGINCSHAADLSATPPVLQTQAPPLNLDWYTELRGIDEQLPDHNDLIDPDVGGVRSALASVGIGYLGYSSNSFYLNMLNVARTTDGHQEYSGQRPTFSTVDVLNTTYDTSRWGIPDGQILLSAVGNFFSWKEAGPTLWGLSQASWYQTLFNRKVELTIGYMSNFQEYINPYVGGAITSSVFGLGSAIQIQGGMSFAAFPKPATTVKVNITPNIYTLGTVQSSLNPDGLAEEFSQNPHGIAWRTDHSGVLFVDETGYKNASDPNVMETWVRAGAAYNTSSFISNVDPSERRSGNSFYYVLGDRQLWQSNPSAGAYRGVYAGFSAMYAPPDLNLFTQYYELRLYALGVFDARPTDLISLTLSDTFWSTYLVDNLALAGNLVHNDSKSATLAYNIHVMHGVYAGLGVSYTDHPSTIAYTPTTGSSLNFLASLNVFY
ncbi:carbohydrate porin [Methylovirgula ligni]|uniref:Porin n=1 Tax=Methylovirgula ligni TaxID=569860 RepID=A0A3D9Z1W4_9HYPH|nr:carbohydrate porin [Methylovirgula ligni]QAY95509.1 carbohydrate porin [Methylovirgula ligni]REF89154.1 porin [Methylovirgula ligni]